MRPREAAQRMVHARTETDIALKRRQISGQLNEADYISYDANVTTILSDRSDAEKAHAHRAPVPGQFG